MRVGMFEAGFMGIGIVGFIVNVVITIAQLYALYLFIRAAKIYIKNNEEFDDHNSNKANPVDENIGG